jgi:predicted Ser/Thr protein kinase
MFEPTTGASGTVEQHPPMQDDDPETVEGDNRDTSGDVFDDDDPDAPNLVPETGPSSRVLPGGFELRQLIGEGGMGQVFLGFHMALECDVAVKVLDPELQLRQDSRERLLREGKVLANIRHENIVQVLHSGVTDDNKVFIVMELLEGETLRQRLRRAGRLDPLAVVKIGLQICRALERAHAAGVIHRDITPSNVMILPDPPDRVKVIDFGICRVLDAFLARHQQRFADPPGARLATPVGVQLGNPEYMAPELLLRAPFAPPNACTDVFSVAVVLFEALTGAHPFRFADRKLARTVREVLPGFEYLELEEALARALRCDPESRTRTMAALRDELELAHDCIVAMREDAARGARLVRLDSFRLVEPAEDAEPRARFLEVVRDDPSEEIEPEPTAAPVVLLRPVAAEVPPPSAGTDGPGGEPPTAVVGVVVAAAIPSPDLAVAPKAAAQGWFAAHMSGVILGTGLVAGVGVTLASQRIGDSVFTTPARVAELEAAADVCEQALEETRASLAQAQDDLGAAREQARPPARPAPESDAKPVAAEERPAVVAAPTSAPPPSTGAASAARHRSIRRSLDKVLAAVQRCDDDAGGGRLSTLRARIRVEPSGEASSVELMDGASIAVCVTKAVRSRRYQAGDEAEWIRHDFVFESEETP